MTTIVQYVMATILHIVTVQHSSQSVKISEEIKPSVTIETCDTTCETDMEHTAMPYKNSSSTIEQNSNENITK